MAIISRCLTWRVKAQGPQAEDGIGAVVERPRMTQMRQVLRILAWSLLVSWRHELCLGKEKAGAFKDLKKIEIVSTEISSPCKK
jgi:hypothetical protein